MHNFSVRTRAAVTALAAIAALVAIAALMRTRVSLEEGAAPLVTPTQKNSVLLSDDSSDGARSAQAQAHEQEDGPSVEATNFATCIVVVVDATSEHPQMGVKVTAWIEHGALQVGEAKGASTDEKGAARLAVPAGNALVLIAHGDGEERGGAHSYIQPLMRGENRTVTIRVPTHPDTRVSGRVLARHDRKPIEGVVISPRSRNGRHSTSSVRSGPDGSFEIPIRSYTTIGLRFDHSGYGPVILSTTASPTGLPEPAEVLLEVAGALGVTLTGLPESRDSYDIAVSGAVADITQPRGLLVGGNGDEVVSARGRQNERIEVRPLTPQVPLALKVRANGVVIWRSPAPILLQPGEVREIEVGSTSTSSIEGQVVDQDGSPTVGVEVLLRPGLRVAPLFVGSNRSTETETVVTDGRGWYLFAGVTAGIWLVGPSPSLADKRQPKSDPSPLLLPLAVEAGESTRRHDIALVRGHYITGRVLTGAGRAAVGAQIEGYCEALSGLQEAQCDAEGLFTLGPLAEGQWILRGRAFGHGESEPLVTAAGARDVVLTLPSEGLIVATVIGQDGRPAVGASITAMLADGTGDAQSVRTDPNGKVTLSGLPLAPHHLVAISVAGEIAVERSIDVGSGSTIYLDLRLVRAGRAKVRFLGPGRSATLLIAQDGIMLQVFAMTAGQTVDVVGPVGSVDASMQARGEPVVRTAIRLVAEGESEYTFDGDWK